MSKIVQLSQTPACGVTPAAAPGGRSGDQEPRDHKENVDASKPAGKPTALKMKHKNGKDSHSAQAIDVGR
jgi:hypothetical protein